MLDIAKKNRLVEQAFPFGLPGFLMAVHDDETNGPVVAVFDTASGKLAGAAHWKNVIVRSPYQGRGIGTEILIKAFEIGIFHPETMMETNYLSEGGRNLHRKVHRTAVSRALDRGEEVLADVLQDYPDLVNRRVKTKLMDTFVKRIRNTIGQETLEDAGVSQEMETDDPTTISGHVPSRTHRPRR
jgi:GNAT superfamily N-acetyltransferase